MPLRSLCEEIAEPGVGGDVAIEEVLYGHCPTVQIRSIVVGVGGGWQGNRKCNN